LRAPRAAVEGRDTEAPRPEGQRLLGVSGPRGVVRTATLFLWSLGTVYGANGTLNLIDAVKSGNHEAVRVLIKQPAEVNATERDGTTALHRAVRAEDLDTVRM